MASHMTFDRHRLPLTALFLLLAWLAAAGQPAATWFRADSSTVVSLLTCAPGSIIYELEGHAALRVRQADGTDITVNWGLFDFKKPNFVYRFVKGETDYMAGAYPTAYFLREYIVTGRRVTQYDLLLTQEQKAAILKAVEENVRPENAVYRYNYVRENCATAILDHIERATGHPLVMPERPSDLADATTFRNAMRHYHRNYPWYQFGIDLALGHGLDAPIDSRELAFAPAALAAMAPEITSDGKRVFADGVALTPGEPEGTACGPTPWWLTPIAAGTAVALLALALSVRDILLRRLSRWFDSIFYLLLGLAGCVITFLVFVSTHYAASPNWLLLWINPLCLVIAVCIWFKRTYKALAVVQWLNLAGIAVYLALAAFGPLQPNSAFFLFLTADAARALTFLIIPSNVFSKKA